MGFIGNLKVVQRLDTGTTGGLQNLVMLKKSAPIKQQVKGGVHHSVENRLGNGVFSVALKGVNKFNDWKLVLNKSV